MNQISLRRLAIAGSTVACAALFSFSWSEQRGVSLSVESAQARVGRPFTPVSVAGVARRQNRRGYRYGYGPGVVGAGLAGAAAVGTAAAVAATSPGWGGGPYYTGTGYAGGPYYSGGGYYAGGPYYQPGVLGARAAYYGGAGNYQPGPGWGGVSSKDYDTYIKNLHDSGYDPKNDFNSYGNVATP